VTLTLCRYIISILEATILLRLSYSYDSMKFDKTNIVERMGALTLIIMGEGIIGMIDSVSAMFKTSSQISDPTVGPVIAAVLLIYVLWMLYFDHADKVNHPGARINKKKPWFQLWAFLHFPLHTAILLTLEGSANFILWWNANEAFKFLLNNFGLYWPDVHNGTELVQRIQLGINNTIDKYHFLEVDLHSEDFKSNLTKLQKLGAFNGSPDNVNDSTFWEILGYMQDTLFLSICGQIDIEIPPDLDSRDADDKVFAVFQVFFDWFITFLWLLAVCSFYLHSPAMLDINIPSLKALQELSLVSQWEDAR
jgi:hypothetical protein